MIIRKMANILDSLFASDHGSAIYKKTTAFVGEYGMDTLINKGVLVGLSGGADSVMLLLYLLEYRRRTSHFAIAAVHINHGIRGEEADSDEEFSRKLCESLEVEFIAKAFDVPSLARERSEGLEECARNIRYSVFDEIISGRDDLCAIATAHHIGDNAETVILNMLRGSGIAGISGIPPVRDNIIRPLLSVSKDEILASLDSSGISYVTDSTNLSNEYKRNFVRHEIIPAMKNICDSPEQMLERLSANAAVDNDFILSAAKDFIEKHEIIKNTELSALHRAVFARVTQILASRVGAEINSKQTNAIYFQLAKNDFSYSIIGAEFICERGICTVRTKSDKFNYDYRTPVSIGKTVIEGYDADVIISESPLDKSSLNVYKISIQQSLASAIINGGLYIRPKEDGDAIFYGGITHKLKKLFNDRKIPPSLRSSIPILCDGCGVLWVPGCGARDDGVKNPEKPLYVTLGIGKGVTLSEPRLHSAKEFKS